MVGQSDNAATRAFLRRAGIIFGPGLGDEVLDEIAPLLEAEGIDVHDPGPVDMSALDAAFARAAERVNLELFTPVGSAWAGSLVVIEVATLAICADDNDILETLLANVVQDQPASGDASVFSIIGVGFGLLDDWNTDPSLRRPVVTEIDGVHPDLVQAAREVLTLAGEGRAFASIGLLRTRHSDMALLLATVYGTALTIASWARQDGVDVAALAGKKITGLI